MSGRLLLSRLPGEFLACRLDGAGEVLKLTILREGVPAGVKAEPVVTTSPYAWEESNPDENPAPSAGEKTGQIALVASSTKNTAGLRTIARPRATPWR